ncbi:MAG TPA: FAD-binding oxidoreductase [Saprospiraceae bacterium]|nr:FAD-binding oxidoreductase [Saprospiraceae bacterium]HQV96020.1 FAD-binding oxidoreductase [Saprospiraceae bacterium]
MQFHTLKINKIVSETNDTNTIYFDIPSHLRENYQFIPGQHLTIKAVINGTELRRAYSICTSTDASSPGITIKKVSGGMMSSYLNDKVKEGDTLEVMTPEGHFVLNPEGQKQRDIYFIAAGSGITPVMSMIKTIVEHEPKSSCYLLYGSRDESNIIFKEQLDMLEKKYADQLVVEHVLSKPIIRKEGGIGGLFAKKIVSWKGKTGRINEQIYSEFFRNNQGQNPEKCYFVCGPGDLIEKTENYLIAQGIDKKQIHKEYFATANTHSDSGVDMATVRVTLSGNTFDVKVPKGKTILDTLIDAKKNPPYSCTSGACSTCMAKVIVGKMTMDQCFALEDDEVEAGYILTCQAHPVTEKVEITFDN